jgi:cupin 2 domain-containing protein
MNAVRNLLSSLPSALSSEIFETIVDSDSVRIERIVSNGQTTPEGEWYDQDHDEWVLVLTGSADLLFDGSQEPQRLGAGDYTLIPTGCRHRVTWTDPNVPTVWLAVHFAAMQLNESGA